LTWIPFVDRVDDKSNLDIMIQWIKEVGDIDATHNTHIFVDGLGKNSNKYGLLSMTLPDGDTIKINTG
jgi:hypothetical protein